MEIVTHTCDSSHHGNCDKKVLTLNFFFMIPIFLTHAHRLLSVQFFFQYFFLLKKEISKAIIMENSIQTLTMKFFVFFIFLYFYNFPSTREMPMFVHIFCLYIFYKMILIFFFVNNFLLLLYNKCNGINSRA